MRDNEGQGYWESKGVYYGQDQGQVRWISARVRVRLKMKFKFRVSHRVRVNVRMRTRTGLWL